MAEPAGDLVAGPGLAAGGGGGAEAAGVVAMTSWDFYVAGQGGQTLLRIGYHLAYPIAARLQLKGHVNIHPSLEKLRQLFIRNIYGCVPLLGSHQVLFLIEDAKTKVNVLRL